MDTDVAYESTRYARQNVLVQASAAMTAQANPFNQYSPATYGQLKQKLNFNNNLR